MTGTGAAAQRQSVTFARVKPPETYTDAMLEFLRTTKFYDQGRPLNAHQVLSNHPPAGRSLNRFLDWGDEAVLTPRERRILILRTASLTRCEYELGVHRQQGVRSGDVIPEEVRALTASAEDADLAAFTDRERALLEIADGICRTDTLTDEQWHHVSAELAAAEIIECLMVVGYYRMCSGLMNALAVPGEGEMSPSVAAASGVGFE